MISSILGELRYSFTCPAPAPSMTVQVFRNFNIVKGRAFATDDLFPSVNGQSVFSFSVAVQITALCHTEQCY